MIRRRLFYLTVWGAIFVVGFEACGADTGLPPPNVGGTNCVMLNDQTECFCRGEPIVINPRIHPSALCEPETFPWGGSCWARNHNECRCLRLECSESGARNGASCSCVFGVGEGPADRASCDGSICCDSMVSCDCFGSDVTTCPAGTQVPSCNARGMLARLPLDVPGRGRRIDSCTPYRACSDCPPAPNYWGDACDPMECWGCYTVCDETGCYPCCNECSDEGCVGVCAG